MRYLVSTLCLVLTASAAPDPLPHHASRPVLSLQDEAE